MTEPRKLRGRIVRREGHREIVETPEELRAMIGETEPRCRRGVEGCECDHHSAEWIAYAAEHGIDLPEVDETCVHHAEQVVRDG